MWFWNIYRDGSVFRLRKLTIELWDGGELMDRRRMFAFPLFNLQARILRKKQRMQRLGYIIKPLKSER